MTEPLDQLHAVVSIPHNLCAGSTPRPKPCAWFAPCQQEGLASPPFSAIVLCVALLVVLALMSALEISRRRREAAAGAAQSSQEVTHVMQIMGYQVGWGRRGVT
jgi:hypothetical protein